MTQTQFQRSEESVACLQELIQANIDSRDGFNEAATNLKPDSPLAVVFSRLARQRGAHAEELQDLVAASEEVPAHSGTFAAAAHRVWIDLRAAFGGGEQSLLEELERCETALERRYEAAINELQNSECNETLRRQFAAVKSAHEKLNALRDECHHGTCA